MQAKQAEVDSLKDAYEEARDYYLSAMAKLERANIALEEAEKAVPVVTDFDALTNTVEEAKDFYLSAEMKFNLKKEELSKLEEEVKLAKLAYDASVEEYDNLVLEYEKGNETKPGDDDGEKNPSEENPGTTPETPDPDEGKKPETGTETPVDTENKPSKDGSSASDTSSNAANSSNKEVVNTADPTNMAGMVATLATSMAFVSYSLLSKRLSNSTKRTDK